jgi:predicted small lipoprotein YifL
MTRPTAAIAVLLACAAAAGCGKKGALLPPLIRTPQKAEAMTVLQRGATLFVEWKNPVKSVDGSPLAGVSEAEVWVLEEEKAAPAPSTMPAPAAMTAKEFEGKARLAASLKRDGLVALRKNKGTDEAGFSYPYSLAGKIPTSLKVRFAVKMRDDRSRMSELSDPVAFDPQVGPGPPQELAARILEDRIELVWKAPAVNFDGSTPTVVSGYNIYRRGKDGPDALVNPSLVREPRYEDRDFTFGAPIRYFVRASATETPPYFESDDSEARALIPVDVFSPAAPAGVVPVAGHGSVSLSWEANREKDLAGYLVRRREEEGAEDVLLTPGLLLENAYTDLTIEKGKRYRYSMSAVDIMGNESARTEVVVDVPGDGPR